MRSLWRRRARNVVLRVMRQNPRIKGDELKSVLRPHYPFGLRYGHPYKIWLSEVKKAVNGEIETPPSEKVEKKRALRLRRFNESME